MQEEDKKPVKYDVDGYEEVTSALGELLNQFPGLLEEEKIKFSTLEKESGIAFYPVTGAVIASEKKSVTGKVNQHHIYHSQIKLMKILNFFQHHH